MPTYVYRCDSCDHQFEVFQKMSDDPLDECPSCSSKVRRVLHPVGIVFKGSGWYINDSKTSSKNTAESSDSSSGTEKTDSGDTSKAASTESGSSEPATKAAAD